MWRKLEGLVWIVFLGVRNGKGLVVWIVESGERKLEFIGLGEMREGVGSVISGVLRIERGRRNKKSRVVKGLWYFVENELREWMMFGRIEGFIR